MEILRNCWLDDWPNFPSRDFLFSHSIFSLSANQLLQRQYAKGNMEISGKTTAVPVSLCRLCKGNKSCSVRDLWGTTLCIGVKFYRFCQITRCVQNVKCYYQSLSIVLAHTCNRSSESKERKQKPDILTLHSRNVFTRGSQATMPQIVLNGFYIITFFSFCLFLS